MLATLVFAALTPLQDPIPPSVISFFGGDDFDRIQGIHVREDLGQVFVTGNTNSDWEIRFGMFGPGVDDTKDALSEGFVARFSMDLKTLDAWSYVGGRMTTPSYSGSDDDRAYTVQTDSAGNVYVYGFSSTDQFFDTAWLPAGTVLHGGGLRAYRDVFLAKFSNDLGTLNWVLRLGGDDEELSAPSAEREQGRNTLLVLDNGTCYVSGGTNNRNFFVGHGITPKVKHIAQQQIDASSPVVNPDNFDAFLAKVNPDGSLAWGTFFGGDGDESAYSGIVLRNGSVFVAGNVNEEDTLGGTANTGLYWGQVEPGTQVVHPGQGLPGTNCMPGPAPCKFQRVYQGGPHGLGQGNGFHHIMGGDGFIAKFDEADGGLKWATYLGGSEFDEISGNEGFRIGANGELYVAGSTKSTDFPMVAGGNPFQATLNGTARDGFVAILNKSASQLLHSTYLGGGDFEELSGLVLDPYGFVYVSGNTSSGANPVPTGTPTADYPTTSTAFQCRNYQQFPTGGQPGVTALLTKLSPNLSTLSYSTYIGGSQTLSGSNSSRERVRSIYWAGGDWCYVGGCTDSSDLRTIHFPTPSPCQALAAPIPAPNPPLVTLFADEDAFLARFPLPFETEL